MSLSWRDQLTAFVAPDAVRVEVRSRGWWPRRGRAVPSSADAVAAVAPDPQGGEWTTLGSQLAEALQAQAGRPFDIAVVLSNHFVRYAVVDNASQLRGPSERAIAAAQALRAVHGSASDAWQVVMDDAATGAALVAGVPRTLVDILYATCRAAGAQRVSIEPLLARSLNDARAEVDASTGWVGVVEQGRLVLASIGDDAVTAVRSQRLLHDPATEVAALVQRARLLDGTPAVRTTVLLASERPLDVAFPPESGLELRGTPLHGVPQAEAA